MKRRNFLKTGFALALASSFLMTEIFLNVYASPAQENSEYSSYKPGDPISPDAFVLDKDLNPHKLLDLIKDSGAQVTMLYIYGGGAMNKPDKLGGIWCRDSFEDSYVLRFIHEKYAENSDVKILSVASAPVYSTKSYDLADRVLLDEPDDSEAFKEARQIFIDSTEDVVFEKIIPSETYYDVRLRLLFNRREDLQPGEGYGQIHDWQGKFRAPGETQKYGTPTIWLLDADGVVLEEAFHGNIYQDQELRYTVLEVDKAIQKHLQE